LKQESSVDNSFSRDEDEEFLNDGLEAIPENYKTGKDFRINRKLKIKRSGSQHYNGLF